MSDFKIDEFGDRLLWFIKSNNLSQNEFSHQLSASPSFVSDLIRGVKKPGTEFLTRIKNHFDVSIDWLLYGEADDQEKKEINIEIFKVVALRVYLVKAALSGDSNAKNKITTMCPTIKTELSCVIKLNEAFDSNQIIKDIDLIIKLYNQYLSEPINNDLYEKIICSAVTGYINSPVDPLLNT